MKNINAFDLVYEQYHLLKEKIGSTKDPHTKNVLYKRLVNLLVVMEFLISLKNVS